MAAPGNGILGSPDERAQPVKLLPAMRPRQERELFMPSSDFPKRPCRMRGDGLDFPSPEFQIVMSQHPSLKSSKSVGAKRNVLKRFERLKQLKAEGRIQEGRSPLGLPKTKPLD